MKTIQPVQVWFSGQETQATVLEATCYNDNLSTQATFQYQLMKVVPMPGTSGSYLQGLAQGTLGMTGATYQAWETNDYAYNWIAQQLNLVITGEYIPTTPTP